MVRFDGTRLAFASLVCVDVHSIEKFTDVVKWFEVLCSSDSAPLLIVESDSY